MNSKQKELKEEIKSLTDRIRNSKKELDELYKNRPVTNDKEKLFNYWVKIQKLYKERDTCRYEFRHKHITASLLRGTPYERIERTVADNNKPNWQYINQLVKSYTLIPEMENESTVCVDSK